MNDRVLSLLGLCRRAGKLVPGFDAAVLSVKAKQAKLLLAAADISEKTFKNLTFEGDRAGVPTLRLNTDLQKTGSACGVKAGVLAVTDEGFARAICNALTGQPPQPMKEEQSL